MAKTLCDWSKKDIENDAKKLHALTREACYFCRKCARVSNQKKALCKAESFEKKVKVKRQIVA